MFKPRIVLLLPILLLSACGGEPQDTRPGQPVAHRRAAFKEMIRHVEPMGVMMRTDAFDANKFHALVNGLMLERDKPWQYFAPDTLYPPSRARAEVWSKPEQFAAEKQAFIDATDKLAAVAGTKDKQIAAEAFAAVQKTCKSCHDAFKAD